jgi:hypothetical protein
LAWMIRLLHQNQLCNEPMLTLLWSWLLSFYLLIAIALGMTERYHRLLASTRVASGTVSLQAVPSSFLLSLWYHWSRCQVFHNFEASLELIIIGNPWWVPTAACPNKWMSMLFDKLSHRLYCSY